MLSGDGLGKELRAKALDTTCYLVNRSPSLVLEDRIHMSYGLIRNPIFHI